MMIPRSFAAQPPLTQMKYSKHDEKENYISKYRQMDPKARKTSISQSSSSFSSSSPRSVSESTLSSRSKPVEIPSRSSKALLQASSTSRPAPTAIQPDLKKENALRSQSENRKPGSAKEVLTATAIPIRKKQRQRTSQRLPNCDHVADFSKLLLEDVRPTKEGNLSTSLSDPQFGGLFGNIDELVEGQMLVGSEGADTGMLSTRSLSSESMPSMISHDDSSLSPSTSRSFQERKHRQLASSEDCASEHPLLSRYNDEGDDDDDDDNISSGMSISPPTIKSPRPTVEERRSSSSFKSSLTASLRALKTAAQSVSSLALTPQIIQPDDFLTRSIFDIQPALTDDRRPPPLDQPPSPALRRYLNPPPSSSTLPPDSPAQLSFWLDDRNFSPPKKETSRIKIKKKYLLPDSDNKPSSKKNNSNLPSIVPLMTCIPSSIRTAHASSPPIWLTADGTPSNKNTAFPLHEVTATVEGKSQAQQLRQREPRENRDFLRVFVCEMNMRRNGKLAEEAAGKAILWLPPVKDDGERKRQAQERWRGWAVDEL